MSSLEIPNKKRKTESATRMKSKKKSKQESVKDNERESKEKTIETLSQKENKEELQTRTVNDTSLENESFEDTNEKVHTPKSPRESEIKVVAPSPSKAINPSDNLVTHYLKSFRIDRLAFVNREQEAFQIADALLSNTTLESGQKFKFVTAGQMYGSGKTEMGRNATRVLAAYPNIRKELTNRYGKELVSQYENSEHVLVELNELTTPNFIPSFQEALAFILYNSLLTTIEKKPKLSPSQFLELKLVTPELVLQEFTTQYPEKSFFVHWDEVGAIESNKYDDFVDMKWKSIKENEGEFDLTNRLARYYSFWEIILPTLQMYRVFTFTAGKSPAFAMIGMKMVNTLVSPSNHVFIVLGGLYPEAIKLTMKATEVIKGTSILQHLEIPEDMVDIFCKKLHKKSAGLPRIVQYALEGLCNGKSELNTPEKIEKALDTVAYNHIVTLRGAEVLVKESILTSSLYDIYISLVVVSVLRIPIQRNYEVKIGESSFLILDLVNILDLYIEPALDDKEFRINFAEYVMKNLKEKITVNKIVDSRIPLIEPFLQDPEIIGLGGEPLEHLTKVVLAFTLAQSQADTSWAKKYGFFNHSTILKDQPANINTKTPISYLPGIQNKVKPIKEEIIKEFKSNQSMIWRKKVPSVNWNDIFKHLFQEDSIGHPAPKSESPDILFNANKAIIGFANKLFVEGHDVTWATISEEINKATPLCDVKPVVLVIVSTSLGEEITTAINSAGTLYLLLDEGSWFYKKKKLIRETKGIGKIVVPKNIEVVILGDGSLKEFLGERNLESLKEFARHRSDVTSFHNSLLPKFKVPTPRINNSGSDLKAIKIAKKSGDVIATYSIEHNTTFADLMTAVQPEVPVNLLTDKIISFYNGKDPNTSIKFPSSFQVQSHANSIIESTIFLHLVPKPKEEGFL